MGMYTDNSIYVLQTSVSVSASDRIPAQTPISSSTKDVHNTSSQHFQVSESQVKLDNIKMGVTCCPRCDMTCCHGALTCQC